MTAQYLQVPIDASVTNVLGRTYWTIKEESVSLFNAVKFTKADLSLFTCFCFGLCFLAPLRGSRGPSFTDLLYFLC